MQIEIIDIKYWMDPQGDSLVEYFSNDCNIYRGCWTESGEPENSLIQLHFSHVSALYCYPREHNQYVTLTEFPKYNSKSNIFRILGSDEEKEYLNYRKHYYGVSPNIPPKVFLFVVQGHDFLHKILARSFDYNKLDPNSVSNKAVLGLLSS